MTFTIQQQQQQNDAHGTSNTMFILLISQGMLRQLIIN